MFFTLDMAVAKLTGTKFISVLVAPTVKKYGSDQIDRNDKKFAEYVQAYILQKIPFDIYLYSYTKTVEEPKLEAENYLRFLNPCKGRLSYPVYLDLEEASIEPKVAERALIFVEIIEK